MLRVVVVDDHPVVREGFKRIISESPGLAVAGEASDGTEALQVVGNTPCDVVVLDISMPNKNGMDVLKHRDCKLSTVDIKQSTFYSGSTSFSTCISAHRRLR